MDNVSRSERSRNAALQAALTIISRDGPGRLTLDAIARESGLSKGGLMHQFRTKEAVLKALLDHQITYFDDFSRRYIAKNSVNRSQPELAAQIATLREAIIKPHSVVFALLGVMAENPDLLTVTREINAKKAQAIKSEATDPPLALLRWAAAWGLALTSMLGYSSLSDKERDKLFERLLDDKQWASLNKPARPRTRQPQAGVKRRLQR